MKQNIRYLVMLLGIVTFQAACSDLPSEYSAEAIEAWVMDVGTKKPIEGVIVTANWQLLGGFEGGLPLGQIMVMETVTDKNGRFFFPAWGPRKRIKGVLRHQDPQLLFFKPGYRYLGLTNTFRDRMYINPVRRSEWNGKTIELKPFKGTMEEYARQLTSLEISLGFAYRGDKCEWKATRRMVASLLNEEKALSQNSVSNSLSRITSLPGQKKCGEAREVLREYLK